MPTLTYNWASVIVKKLIVRVFKVVSAEPESAHLTLFIERLHNQTKWPIHFNNVDYKKKPKRLIVCWDCLQEFCELRY